MESSLSPTQDASGAQLAFLKNASDKRVTRDGNPPKRRGPKPDSRPALTRRQELNRQAQRTHRERKELYIKALEDEVLRLKEIYSNIAQDKDRLADENRQLKELLLARQQGGAVLGNGGSGPSSGPSSGGAGGHGPSPGVGGPGDDSASNPSVGYSGSASGSYGPPAPSSNTSAYTPPPYGQRGGIASPTGPCPLSARSAPCQPQHQHQHQQQSTPTQLPQIIAHKNPSIDYEQAGIDFVLTLEKPCMEHMPWLLEHSVETSNSICGHALMASCPPKPFHDLPDDAPFGYRNIEASIVPGAGAVPEPSTFAPGTAPGQRTWELSKVDLNTLLSLSAKLDLDGEITPVMAWGMVLAHPRLGELSLNDFAKLTEELVGKVRCYGFGAVMEEFEVRDALENMMSTKPDSVSAGAYSMGTFAQSQLQPFVDHSHAGHTHNVHPTIGHPSAQPVMYPPGVIQPGFAMAM